MYDVQKQSSEFLEKIISSYDHVCDEEALFRKCQSAISIVDKLEKELGSDIEYGTYYILSNLLGNVQVTFIRFVYIVMLGSHNKLTLDVTKE